MNRLFADKLRSRLWSGKTANPIDNLIFYTLRQKKYKSLDSESDQLPLLSHPHSWVQKCPQKISL